MNEQHNTKAMHLVDMRGFTYQYRDFVESTRWYKGAGERDSEEANYIVLGIAGEAGETADAWKKAVREHGISHAWENMTNGARMKMIQEGGDVLWYIQDLCIFLGIDLQELMLLNTIKLYERLKANGREVSWPLKALSYDEARVVAQEIEDQIISVSRRDHVS
jgi:NTP pyrophosphatase (non-canonical NTP hydrolase)